MGEENKLNLKQQLGQLFTIEGRASVVSTIVGHVDIPDEYLKEVIEHYEKMDEAHLLAEIYRKTGQTDKANEYYIRLIGEYEKEERFYKAGRLAKAIGLEERATELFEKGMAACDLVDPSKLGEETQKGVYIMEKVSQHLQEKGHTTGAGEFAESARLVQKHASPEREKKLSEIREKSRTLTETIPVLYKRAKEAKECGLEEKAQKQLIELVEMCEELEAFGTAGKFAKEAGLDETAKKLFIKGMEFEEKYGEFDVAADIAEAAGFIEKAENYRALEKIMALCRTDELELDYGST